jgi:hypothetical protein
MSMHDDKPGAALSLPPEEDGLLLPPTPKGRRYELHARGIRSYAGVVIDEVPLDPFSLARKVKLLVVNFHQIEGLSPETKKFLLGEGSDLWSGGVCSRPLPNGWKLVILNPTHGQQRHSATLMEEICHVFLAHDASRLEIVNQNGAGKMIARDYNEADEQEAYAVGAAALVPYTALHRFVCQGKSLADIARHFRVSRRLVQFRLQVSKLWPEYKARHPEETAGREASRAAPVSRAAGRPGGE